MQFAPAATVAFAGQEILGAVWSTIVTANEQIAVLPAASVAVRVTVWLPENTVPAAGLWVSVGLAEQLSVAVTDAA